MILPTLPPEQYADGHRWSELGDVAADAEAAGVDALWACDHVSWHGPTLDCMVAATVAAERTRSITIGTGVLQLPLREPHVLAKTASSVQLIADGRFILGVGVGQHRGEYDAVGAPFETRGADCDAALDVLDRAWQPTTARYAQRPVAPRIPLWVGGHSDAALARAVRRGDGWMSIFMSPERYERRRADLHAGLVDAGRDPDRFTSAILLFVAAGDPAANDVRADGLAWLSGLYGLPTKAFERHLIAGSPADCAEQLEAYFAAGASHLAIYPAGPDALAHTVPVVEALGLAAGVAS